MLTKEQVLGALSTWIRQRPGLDFANYGDARAYNSELRSITKDLQHARTLLRAVELRGSITAEDIIAAFPRAYSGRLTITEKDGRAVLNYCTGQYWPTEYRRAACAVLASALWDWARDCAMPQCHGYMLKAWSGKEAFNIPMFSTRDEAEACLARNGGSERGHVAELYEGDTAGTWLRKFFTRELGRAIAKRWFD